MGKPRAQQMGGTVPARSDLYTEAFEALAAGKGALNASWATALDRLARLEAERKAEAAEAERLRGVCAQLERERDEAREELQRRAESTVCCDCHDCHDHGCEECCGCDGCAAELAERRLREAAEDAESAQCNGIGDGEPCAHAFGAPGCGGAP